MLEVAEAHFAARGYAAVTLKDIADALSIKQPSLYYHVPGGKEALYVEVMLRALERHRAALDAAGAGAPDEVAARLLRMATWIVQQPPMNITRMIQSDLPALPLRHRRQLAEALRRCLMEPVERVFAAAPRRALRQSPRVCAGGFWALVQSLQAVREVSHAPEAALVAQAVDLALYGAIGT